MKKFSYSLLLVFLCTFLFFIPSCTTDAPADEGKTETGPFEVTSRLRSEPDRLNPILTAQAASLHVIYQLFPSLLNRDPFTLQLKPMLAKSLPDIQALKEGEYDGDATHKYTFEILDEAVWDNGQPVLASDYLFTLKAIFNSNVTAASPYKGLLHFLRDFKIDPDNPKKFNIYVKGVFRADAGTGFYIMPEHVYDPTGLMRNFEFKDLTDQVIGKKLAEDPKMKEFAESFMSSKYSRDIVGSCGPYKLISWDTDQQIVLEKKKDWWGDKVAAKNTALTANPDKIIFKVIKDETAAITAMKDGSLDIVSSLTSAGFTDVKGSNLADQFNFHTPARSSYSYMGLNTKQPKLVDKRVRRAIAHLVNVNKIIETLQLGYAQPIVSFIQKDAPYGDNKLQQISLEIEKAKSLLAEAGWKDSNGDGVVDKMINGKQTELIVKIISTPGSSIAPPLTSLIAEDAKKAGVIIELDVMDAKTMLANLAKRDFDAWFAGSSFDLDDYDPYQIWHTDSDNPKGYNRTGFGNAVTDAIILEIRSTDNPDRRVELYHQLQGIVYDEQPMIFLYNPQDRIVTQKHLKNVVTSPKFPGYFENYFER